MQAEPGVTAPALFMLPSFREARLSETGWIEAWQPIVNRRKVSKMMHMAHTLAYLLLSWLRC